MTDLLDDMRDLLRQAREERLRDALEEMAAACDISGQAATARAIRETIKVK